MHADELARKGARVIRESGDFFNSRISRQECAGRFVYTLWINGSPIADTDTSAECRHLLAVCILAAPIPSGQPSAPI